MNKFIQLSCTPNRQSSSVYHKFTLLRWLHFLIRDLTLFTHLSIKFRLRLGSPEMFTGRDITDSWTTSTASDLTAAAGGLLSGGCGRRLLSSWLLRYCSHSLSSCWSVLAASIRGSTSSRMSRLRDRGADRLASGEGVAELRRGRCWGLVGGRRRPISSAEGLDDLGNLRQNLL